MKRTGKAIGMYLMKMTGVLEPGNGHDRLDIENLKGTDVSVHNHLVQEVLLCKLIKTFSPLPCSLCSGCSVAAPSSTLEQDLVAK